ALAMPLIDLLRPGIANLAADVGRADRVIAHLGMAIGMLVHTAAEMVREHLRAEADAEKRLLLPQRYGEPIDLAANEIGAGVRAHGTTEKDGGGMTGHGRGQLIVKAGAADVEPITALAQRVTDTPRARGLLVQDDQNRLRHAAIMSCKMGRISI